MCGHYSGGIYAAHAKSIFIMELVCVKLLLFQLLYSTVVLHIISPNYHYHNISWGNFYIGRSHNTSQTHEMWCAWNEKHLLIMCRCSVHVQCFLMLHTYLLLQMTFRLTFSGNFIITKKEKLKGVYFLVCHFVIQPITSQAMYVNVSFIQMFQNVAVPFFQSSQLQQRDYQPCKPFHFLLTTTIPCHLRL